MTVERDYSCREWQTESSPLAAISFQLGRLLENQQSVKAEVAFHGQLLHELINLQRETVKLQVELGRKNIAPDKGSSQQEMSLASSKPTAKDVLQWLAAATMVTWVIRGGSPEALLKALAALSGV